MPLVLNEVSVAVVVVVIESVVFFISMPLMLPLVGTRDRLSEFEFELDELFELEYDELTDNESFIIISLFVFHATLDAVWPVLLSCLRCVCVMLVFCFVYEFATRPCSDG